MILQPSHKRFYNPNDRFIYQESKLKEGGHISHTLHLIYAYIDPPNHPNMVYMERLGIGVEEMGCFRKQLSHRGAWPGRREKELLLHSREPVVDL